jgi:hypothetical protein
MSATNVSGRRRPARHSRDVKTLAEARREFVRKRSRWLIDRPTRREGHATNTIGDRALGRFPAHREVSRSKTAQTLDPDAVGVGMIGRALSPPGEG